MIRKSICRTLSVRFIPVRDLVNEIDIASVAITSERADNPVWNPASICALLQWCSSELGDDILPFCYADPSQEWMVLLFVPPE